MHLPEIIASSSGFPILAESLQETKTSAMARYLGTFPCETAPANKTLSSTFKSVARDLSRGYSSPSPTTTNRVLGSRRMMPGMALMTRSILFHLCRRFTVRTTFSSPLSPKPVLKACASKPGGKEKRLLIPFIQNLTRDRSTPRDCKSLSSS